MAHINHTIKFPISDIRVDVRMKHIPLLALPNLHGLSSKDPDTFLFEFDVVYRGNDYIYDAKKLKI